MSHFVKFGTTVIKVPKTMIFEDKNGNYKLGMSLTAKNNVSTRNKIKSIIFEPTDSNKFSIEEGEKVRLAKSTKEDAPPKNSTKEAKPAKEINEYDKFNKTPFYSTKVATIPFFDEFEKLSDKEINKNKTEFAKRQNIALPMDFIYVLSTLYPDCAIFDPVLSEAGKKYEKEYLVPPEPDFQTYNSQLTFVPYINQSIVLKEKTPESPMLLHKTPDFIKNVKKTEKDYKESGKRFIIVHGVVYRNDEEDYVENGQHKTKKIKQAEKHQTVLILDAKDRTGYYFNSHGDMCPDDKLIKKLFDELDYTMLHEYDFESNNILGAIVPKDKWVAFLKSSDVGNVDLKNKDFVYSGIQILEDLTKNEDFEGLCYYWGLMFAHLYVSNPDIHPVVIYRELFKKLNYNIINLQNYMFFYALKMKDIIDSFLDPDSRRFIKTNDIPKIISDKMNKTKVTEDADELFDSYYIEELKNVTDAEANAAQAEVVKGLTKKQVSLLNKIDDNDKATEGQIDDMKILNAGLSGKRKKYISKIKDAYLYDKYDPDEKDFYYVKALSNIMTTVNYFIMDNQPKPKKTTTKAKSSAPTKREYEFLYREQKDDEEDEKYYDDIISNAQNHLQKLKEKKKRTKMEEYTINEIEADLVDIAPKIKKWFKKDIIF